MWLQLSSGPVLAEAGRGCGCAAAPPTTTPAAQLWPSIAAQTTAAAAGCAQAQRVEGRYEAAGPVRRERVTGQLFQVGGDPVGRGVGPLVQAAQQVRLEAPAAAQQVGPVRLEAG